MKTLNRIDAVDRDRRISWWRKPAVLALTLMLTGSSCAQLQEQTAHEAQRERIAGALPLACEALVSLQLRDTTITSATSIPAGTYSPPDVVATAAQVPGMQIANLPAFCRVLGTVFPSIDFEVWLPAASVWNGKFAATGSGALGGYINYAQGPASKTGIAFNLRRGYAVAATNQGHIINTTAWMLDPGRLVDYAYRGNHEVAVRAKALIKAHYGSAPKYSYFEGCSIGGTQGLMAAQRYPLDFDGIVSGAPANLLRGGVNSLWNGNAILKDPATNIPTAKLPLIYNAVAAACDGADGLMDGIVTNPPACRFDPNVLLCKGGDAADCLTAPQIQGLNKIYQGATSPSTGERIQKGFSLGGETNWAAIVTGPVPQGSTIAWHTWAVFEDPSWDWKTYDFDSHWDMERNKFLGIFDAADPDMRPFRDRGGKLLMWHGWADNTVAPQNTVDYYDAIVGVIAADKPNRDPVRATQSFARLFMNPGVSHCTGGIGADNTDLFAALEQWVEKGVKPDRIVASKIVNGTTQFTRPLCPHPEVAMYKGGNPNDESSFVCRSPR